MRILIVNFEYPPLGGGGGVATAQIAEGLASRHRVDVLTSRYADLMKEEVSSGVVVHRVAAWGRRQLSAASFLSLVLFVPAAIWRGWKLCREHDFDVINAQFVLPSGVVAAVLARWFGIPLVVSFIGGDVYDPSKMSSPHRFGVLRWLVRWIAGQAQGLTAISEDTKCRVQELHGVIRDITVVPVGYWPIEVMSVDRESLGLPSDAMVLISVGRLIARKRFERLLESMLELPDAFLVIVGAGSWHDKLVRRAKELGVAERVLFAGFVTDERKMQLLQAADVYVSAAEHEGFGIVFLEAMAAGLPVVAVANGGQEDFLKEGVNGFLVADSEPALLAGGVKQLMADDNLRARMGDINQREVVRYEANNVAREFEEVLVKVGGAG